MMDDSMWGIVEHNKNMTVPWYLMASVAYYVEDSPILTDSAFDSLAKYMLQHWSDIKHRHKSLITAEELDAGTLLAPTKLPSIVTDALGHLRQYGADMPEKAPVSVGLSAFFDD
jgi:hypothetical protein